MDRLVWVGALPSEDIEDVRSIVASALEAGFDQIVLDHADDGLQRLGRFSPILLREGAFLFDGQEVGRLATIRRAEDERSVRALRGATKHVVVRAEDWKIIPLENLIAHFQGSGTRLLVEVHDASEAKLFFETMEVGVDGVLLTPRTAKEVRAVRELLEARAEAVPLVIGKVLAIRSLGLGDRVCVDTCSLLRDGEGMLVGNASSGLFLIHAETVEAGYVAPRPFRVNAGPVHAYVLLPDGKTKYLSELRAGDEVLAVDARGESRAVIVGRVKIERRPLLLVEADAAGKRLSTIVQNAETIRFVAPGGGAVSVSDLHPGDEVLLHLEEGGRHFGMRIQETIAER
ncbi:MAG TPA: 3-dehydroquinate synthase II [Thermoplasmata archaeon]|nr:3-dehydroquinate synthase II [Thermoplasmata archaeon]